LELPEALPLALEAAKNGETISVRISAINALGALGGADAKAFLATLLDGTEERFKPPAQVALSQIDRREQSAARASQKRS
jgi:hypothetical protein